MKQEKINTSTGRPILIVESFEFRKTIALNVNIFSIGRNPKCSLVINHKLVSRYHATIAWLRDKDNHQKYAYWIIDGKGQRQRSKNGILVNGVKTLLHPLHSGDIISLGNHTKITYSHIADTTDNLKITDTVYYL